MVVVIVMEMMIATMMMIGIKAKFTALFMIGLLNFFKKSYSTHLLA